MSIPKSYSIVVTTYSKRFDKFFVPLIKSITKYRPDIEIIAAVNGSMSGEFNEKFRSDILSFVSDYPKVFPRLYPKVASFSRLVNDGCINSNGKSVLLLNDDVGVDETFFDKFESVYAKEDGSFLINGTYSHSLWNVEELDEVGYFDERFVGFGWEDVDFWIRYAKTFGVLPKIIEISGIMDHSDKTSHPKYKDDGHNTTIVGGITSKYSLINKIVFEKFYPTFPLFADPFWRTATVDDLVVIDKQEDQGDAQYPYEEYIAVARKELIL